MRKPSLLLAISAALLAAGCGETVSAEERVQKCLNKQPDATKSDCEQWEKDGELQDSGVHKDHENM